MANFESTPKSGDCNRDADFRRRSIREREIPLRPTTQYRARLGASVAVFVVFFGGVVQLRSQAVFCVMDIRHTLDSLIDRWCERRALRPLQLLFRAYPGSLAHADQLFELLSALKDIKGLCKAELTEDELRMLIETHNALEDTLRGYEHVT